MLLSSVDFEKYKSKLELNLKRTFSSSEEFEEHVKTKLGAKNTRIFVSNIARAIILQNSISFDLDRYTDKEIVTLINISKNKEKLLKYKDQENFKPYLELINADRLEVVESLEKVFFNTSIEKLLFTVENKEVNSEEIQIEKENNSLEEIKKMYKNSTATEQNEIKIWFIKEIQNNRITI